MRTILRDVGLGRNREDPDVVLPVLRLFRENRLFIFLEHDAMSCET